MFADVYDRNGRASRNALVHQGAGIYSTIELTFSTKDARYITVLDSVGSILRRVLLVVRDPIAAANRPAIFAGKIKVETAAGAISAQVVSAGIEVSTGANKIKITTDAAQLKVDDLTEGAHIDV